MLDNKSQFLGEGSRGTEEILYLVVTSDLRIRIRYSFGKLANTYLSLEQ